MVNPVTATDGINYEKVAIELWLEKYDTLPMTSEECGRYPNGKPILIRNKALREAIETYKQEQAPSGRMADLRSGTTVCC